MLINRDDVGCWIVKANPEVWGYFDAREDDEDDRVSRYLYSGGWTLGNNYRNDLMVEGDLIAVMVTGADHPGLYEFGWISGPLWEAPGFELKHAVDMQRARRPHMAVPYTAVRLRWDNNYVPRKDMKDDTVLSGAEHYRAPQMANPTYCTPTETRRLAELLRPRVSASAFKASRWAALV